MSRKFEEFSGRLWIYESGQHPHAISLGYLLVVHSKRREKRRNYYALKKKTQLLSEQFAGCDVVDSEKR